MRDHRVVVRVGVLRDVEILLHLAPGVREERPVGADAAAKLVRLEQVVGRDRDETAVADLHLAVELQEPFVLPPVLRTEAAAGEHQHQRIVALQLRERAVLAAVVGELVVGKDGAGDDVGRMRPHTARERFNVERGVVGRVLGRAALLARDDVGGVPVRPVVLRSGRFVLAVAFSASRRRSVSVATSSCSARVREGAS